MSPSSHHTRGTRPPRFAPRFGLRSGVLATLVLALAVLGAGPASAEEPAALSESALKSAFLYNFARFVTWPGTAWSDPGAPMTFGVVAADSLLPSLEEALRGKAIQGHPLEVRRISGTADLEGCQVVYLDTDDRHLIRLAMQVAEKRAILTVGESREFARQGGMITFVRKGTTLGFEINNRSAELAGLRISSRLLSLAMAVPQ